MQIDIETLSLEELKALGARVNRAIASFDERRKKEVLAELEETARARGFSLAELTGTKAPRKRAAAAAKYANPENAAQTWTGRGRPPAWFSQAIAAGHSRESMSV